MSHTMQRKEPRLVNGIIEWQCPTCSEWKPSDGFYASATTWNGLRSQCKRCHTLGNLRTRDVSAAADRNREYARKWRAGNPDEFRAKERSRVRPYDEKRKARAALNNAVRRGRVVRPDVCSKCGSAGRITGHHDDYSKPLDVTWLCYECHGLEHRSC